MPARSGQQRASTSSKFFLHPVAKLHNDCCSRSKVRRLLILHTNWRKIQYDRICTALRKTQCIDSMNLCFSMKYLPPTPPVTPPELARCSISETKPGSHGSLLKNILIQRDLRATLSSPPGEAKSTPASCGYYPPGSMLDTELYRRLVSCGSLAEYIQLVANSNAARLAAENIRSEEIRLGAGESLMMKHPRNPPSVDTTAISAFRVPLSIKTYDFYKTDRNMATSFNDRLLAIPPPAHVNPNALGSHLQCHNLVPNFTVDLTKTNKNEGKEINDNPTQFFRPWEKKGEVWFNKFKFTIKFVAVASCQWYDTEDTKHETLSFPLFCTSACSSDWQKPLRSFGWSRGSPNRTSGLFVPGWADTTMPGEISQLSAPAEPFHLFRSKLLNSIWSLLQVRQSEHGEPQGCTWGEGPEGPRSSKAPEEAVHLQVLREALHQVLQPADPRAHAHRRKVPFCLEVRSSSPWLFPHSVCTGIARNCHKKTFSCIPGLSAVTSATKHSEDRTIWEITGELPTFLRCGGSSFVRRVFLPGDMRNKLRKRCSQTTFQSTIFTSSYRGTLLKLSLAHFLVGEVSFPVSFLCSDTSTWRRSHLNVMNAGRVSVRRELWLCTGLPTHRWAQLRINCCFSVILSWIKNKKRHTQNACFFFWIWLFTTAGTRICRGQLWSARAATRSSHRGARSRLTSWPTRAERSSPALLQRVCRHIATRRLHAWWRPSRPSTPASLLPRTKVRSPVMLPRGTLSRDVTMILTLMLCRELSCFRKQFILLETIYLSFILLECQGLKVVYEHISCVLFIPFVVAWWERRVKERLVSLPLFCGVWKHVRVFDRGPWLGPDWGRTQVESTSLGSACALCGFLGGRKNNVFCFCSLFRITVFNLDFLASKQFVNVLLNLKAFLFCWPSGIKCQNHSSFCLISREAAAHVSCNKLVVSFQTEDKTFNTTPQ